MKKVSIIVPVYNTANYLRNCLDSIVSQTYQNIQIILVDDGSTDESGIICDQYTEKDSRIRVIHKKNAGVSAARNTGLEVADGDFVAFFDSDDEVLPNMIEDLVKTADEYNVAIVQSAGPIIPNVPETGNVKVLNKNRVLDENFSFSDYYKPSLWLGIYRADLFNGIRFPDEIHFYEDFTVLTLLAAKADQVAFLDRRYYNYIQRIGSANHSGMTMKRWSALKIPDFLDKQGVFRTKQDRINVTSFFIVSTFFVCIISNSNDNDYLANIKKILHSNVMTIVSAKSPKFSMRIASLSYIVLPQITHFILSRLLRN